MNLLNLWNTIECYLFPHLEDILARDLSKREREFVRVCSLAELDQHILELEWARIGRKSKDRLSILKAFVAKAFYNLDTNRSLINYLGSSPSLRRLCGWEYKHDIPHESKFSRVFALIASHKLCQRIHASMIKANCGNRIIGHLSRDSTAIDAREKVTVIKENKVKTPQKLGRPKKG
ncbi:MAG: transposase [Lentisphaeraceae bacterium]|nr:transposase [Lentisphaeraceae bacterium]